MLQVRKLSPLLNEHFDVVKVRSQFVIPFARSSYYFGKNLLASCERAQSEALL